MNCDGMEELQLEKEDEREKLQIGLRDGRKELKKNHITLIDYLNF